MKKMLLGLLLGITFQAGAATSITTPSVSGHWTMTGSPYNVYNDISILANTSLSIDPGVQVVFHGLYRVNVQGVLRAVGTVTQPISFKANDTTGWHDDLSAAGGWRGIQFNMYASTGPDTSALEHCTITDMKYGASGYMGYNTGCLFADENRHLTVKNCEFAHNIAEAGYGRCIVLYGSHTIDSCDIHDNRAARAIVAMSLAQPEVKNSSIHHNNSWQILVSELLDPSKYHSANILNCDIYENTTRIQGAQINVNTGHAIIKGNKIHHNTNMDEGAVFCNGGQVEITNNLICNNQQIVAGTCGAVEGGGAMHLSSNSSTTTWDSTAYIVRNNVIVNNYSASGMGAGVYVWHARVWIMNNTIVNNVGGGPYGVAIGLINMGSNAYIKNNILYNNDPLLSSAPLPEVWVLNADTVEFENNWMPRAFSQMVTSSAGAYVLAGDTTTNIIGVNPNLLHPTAAASAAESALTSDFALTAISTTCINKGDNSDCLPYATDYAGNPRINSGTIDIGAYEYQSVAHVNVIAEAQQILVYPVPASDKITVVLPSATGLLKITDATGRTISTHNVSAKNFFIDTHTYPSGLYMMQWTSGNEPVQVKKFIVE